MEGFGVCGHHDSSGVVHTRVCHLSCPGPFQVRDRAGACGRSSSGLVRAQRGCKRKEREPWESLWKRRLPRRQGGLTQNCRKSAYSAARRGRSISPRGSAATNAATAARNSRRLRLRLRLPRQPPGEEPDILKGKRTFWYPAMRVGKCPACGSTNTGHDSRGLPICHACGHQWHEKGKERTGETKGD